MASYVEVAREAAVYGFDFGGMLSLFLGVSFMTIWHLLLALLSKLNMHMYIRVYRENMFFKKRISATHNASACGLVRRDPKIFLISTMFRGSLGHLKFDHFYIVDFHSALAFLDRDLRSED